MALTSPRLAGAILFCAFASFGYTQCEDFKTVTVPTSDGTRPSMGAKIDINGDRQLVFDGGSVRVDDEDANVILIPGMIDNGGAHRLDFTPHGQVECKSTSGGLGQIVNVSYRTYSDEQSGSPGSRVSNGIYLLHSFRFSDLTRLCGSGFRVERAEVGFIARGVDFHGNSRTMSARVDYVP